MSDYGQDDAYVSEVYFELVKLDEEQLEGIAALCGIYPDEYFRSGEDDAYETGEEKYDPRALELMFFLINAVQLVHGIRFDRSSDDAFPELVTYAEYLMDAMHLIADTKEPRLPVLVLGSLLASTFVDARSRAGDGVLERYEREKALLIAEAEQLSRVFSVEPHNKQRGDANHGTTVLTRLVSANSPEILMANKPRAARCGAQALDFI